MTATGQVGQAGKAMGMGLLRAHDGRATVMFLSQLLIEGQTLPPPKEEFETRLRRGPFPISH